MIYLGSCICTVKGLAVPTNCTRALPEPLHIFAGDASDHDCYYLCLDISILVSYTSRRKKLSPAPVLDVLMHGMAIFLWLQSFCNLHFATSSMFSGLSVLCHRLCTSINTKSLVSFLAVQPWACAVPNLPICFYLLQLRDSTWLSIVWWKFSYVHRHKPGDQGEIASPNATTFLYLICLLNFGMVSPSWCCWAEVLDNIRRPWALCQCWLLRRLHDLTSDCSEFICPLLVAALGTTVGAARARLWPSPIANEIAGNKTNGNLARYSQSCPPSIFVGGKYF